MERIHNFIMVHCIIYTVFFLLVTENINGREVGDTTILERLIKLEELMIGYEAKMNILQPEHENINCAERKQKDHELSERVKGLELNAKLMEQIISQQGYDYSIMKDRVKTLELHNQILEEKLNSIQGHFGLSLTDNLHIVESMNEIVEKENDNVRNQYTDNVYKNMTKLQYKSDRNYGSSNRNRIKGDEVVLTRILKSAKRSQKKVPDLLARGSSLPETVAFTARMSNAITNLPVGNLVVFDNIITNIGNSYSPHTGEFTCLLPGIYAFSLTIVSTAQPRIETYIMKDNGLMVGCVADSAGEYGSGSTTVLLNLSVGDRVWVKLAFVENGYRFDGIWCSFSGFLIQ